MSKLNLIEMDYLDEEGKIHNNLNDLFKEDRHVDKIIRLFDDYRIEHHQLEEYLALVHQIKPSLYLVNYPISEFENRFTKKTETTNRVLFSSYKKEECEEYIKDFNRKYPYNPVKLTLEQIIEQQEVQLKTPFGKHHDGELLPDQLLSNIKKAGFTTVYMHCFRYQSKPYCRVNREKITGYDMESIKKLNSIIEEYNKNNKTKEK